MIEALSAKIGSPSCFTRAPGWMLMKCLVRLLLGAIVACLVPVPAAATINASAARMAPVELTVYNAAGTHVIGHGHYSFIKQGAIITLSGEVQYLNGGRDVEVSKIAEEPNRPPRLKSFRQSYFGANGAAELVESLDLVTGHAQCDWSERLSPRDYTALLNVPADTYAGAIAALPLEEAFSHGEHQTQINMFECIPDPRIIAIDAKLESDTRWPFHSGLVAQVKLVPDLGWLTVLASPFLPSASVWLDPADGWEYLGARKSRFYGGREQLLVRKFPHSPPLASPPVSPARHTAQKNG